MNEDQHWAIFPNPVETQINISQKGTIEKAVFILYDAFGRTQKRVHLSSQETPIDMISIAKGWYAFQIISVDGQLIGSGTLVKK